MSSPPLSNAQHPGTDSLAEKGVLLDLLIIVGRYKKLIIGVTVLAALLSMAISLLLPPIFSSTSKIMPPQQPQAGGVAAVIGQLGGLGGAASSIAGLKNPNDLYVGLLMSRTVSDNLISRFKLKERYRVGTMDEARVALANATVIANGLKDGLISVTVFEKEPQFAADVANAYVNELIKLTQTMALTEAAKRRVFFEKQLKDARDDLAAAEIALKATQERTGMIQPDGQVQAIISNLAQLKGTIAAKEVQINAMRTFATGQNPDLMRALEELRSLQAQASKLERTQPSGSGDPMVPTGKIPEIGVEYVRGMRNVKYYETIFELLAKQFELAKIDEAKESSVIQVLDNAVPAERRSKPQRTLITLMGTFAGAVLAVLLSFAHAAYVRNRVDSAKKQRFDDLSNAWLGK